MTESVEQQVPADLGAWVRMLAHTSNRTMVWLQAEGASFSIGQDDNKFPPAPINSNEIADEDTTVRDSNKVREAGNGLELSTTIVLLNFFFY
jgi:hypothetical protein